MKYTILTTKQFDKALKRCYKRGYPMEKLRTAIKELSTNGCLTQNIVHIGFMATMRENGKHILPPTGCSFGNKMTKS